MKLELKYLAPYLPYGIKVMVPYGIDDLVGIHFSDDTDYNKTSITKHNINNPLANTECQTLNFTDIKPILRPMSDLDKEIKVNEDYVITMEEIFISAFGGIGGCGITNNGDKIFIAQYCTEKITFNTSYLCFETYAIAPDGESEWNPPFNQLQLFEKLYQYHFDVFGLIEQGLAIDINTLQS